MSHLNHMLRWLHLVSWLWGGLGCVEFGGWRVLGLLHGDLVGGDRTSERWSCRKFGPGEYVAKGSLLLLFRCKCVHDVHLSQITSLEMVEVLARRYACSFAIEQWFSPLISADVCTYVDIIIYFFRNFQILIFSHVFGEVNCMAHACTQYALFAMLGWRLGAPFLLKGDSFLHRRCVDITQKEGSNFELWLKAHRQRQSGSCSSHALQGQAKVRSHQTQNS